MRAIVHTHATNIFAAVIGFRCVYLNPPDDEIITVPEVGKNCLVKVTMKDFSQLEKLNLSFNTDFVNLYDDPHRIVIYCAPCGQQWLQLARTNAYLIGRCRNLVYETHSDVRFRQVDNLICNVSDENDVMLHADACWVYNIGFDHEEFIRVTMDSDGVNVDNFTSDTVHCVEVYGETECNWVPVGRSEFTELVQWRRQI
jgi:hypothetical protein